MAATNLNFSGKVGNYIYRKCYGKTIVYPAPDHHKIPMDEISVANRARFSVACSLAKVINRIPELKQIWAMYTQNKMSSYNLILKSNYNAISGEQSYDNVIITPSSFHKLYIEPIRRKPSAIIKSIRHTDPQGNFPSVKYHEKLAQIILAKVPKDNSLPDYKFFSYISSPVSESKAGFSYTNFIPDHDEQILQHYSEFHIFYTFIQFNLQNTPLQSSNTIYGILLNSNSPNQ